MCACWVLVQCPGTVSPLSNTTSEDTIGTYIAQVFHGHSSSERGSLAINAVFKRMLFFAHRSLLPKTGRFMNRVRQNRHRISKLIKWPSTHVQIRLEQTNHVKVHISEQISHAMLAISPCVVNPKVDSPYPCVQDSGARMCRHWGRRRRRRPS
jgi:hypothetical protein